jgi:hypothetical protein
VAAFVSPCCRLMRARSDESPMNLGAMEELRYAQCGDG